MSFPAAVGQVFRRYAVFSGRASRPEFWWFVLFLSVASIVTEVLDSLLFPSLLADPYSSFTPGDGPLALILGVVTIVPALAVSTRRLHDFGDSGWWACILLIPVIGWIWAAFLYSTKGDPEANEYGPPVTALPTDT